MFKKFLAMLMCLVLICGIGVVASAEGGSSADEYNQTVSENGENLVQPCYDYTNIITATLANSGGKAVCAGSVMGYNGTTTKIVLTMTLQKKTLLWWSKVQEWTVTVNNYTAAISKTVSVDSGTHRVKVEAKVYAGSNYENVDCTSKTYTF